MTNTDKGKKTQKLRQIEYYSLQPEFDALYARSQEGKSLYKLMQLITDERNITLAYRRIKRNKGSMTRGTNETTISNIEIMETADVIAMVRENLADYKPKPVRRILIPKPGKVEKRPLGIPSFEDRLIQQCILQVLEPICEAQFHPHSYGFRPNRKTKDAIARLNTIAFSGNHYAVDIDIKGFFDNVNHSKLKRQLWALGIRDKQIISIIDKMLKAPIEGEGIPLKGTPQGGILSPLLANVVLNELDWWVSSQWETFKTQKEYSNSGKARTGLRTSSDLKEMYFVRYADDFKILCRDYSTAVRIFEGTKSWIKERLKLDISPEKSGIVNLRRKATHFLGIDIKVVHNGKRYITRSWVGKKEKDRIVTTIKEKVDKLSSKATSENVNHLNGTILGIQNYYRMASMVNIDFSQIWYGLGRHMKNRLRKIAHARGHPTKTYKRLYGDYNCMITYVGKLPIFPFYGVKYNPPLKFNQQICDYTEMGRELIHDRLSCIDGNVMKYIMQNPIKGRSIEYNDNRISVYSAQRGKCAITRVALTVRDMFCLNKIPLTNKGTDRFDNLIYISTDAKVLIDSDDAKEIKLLLTKYTINQIQKQRLNELRLMTGNFTI